MFNIESIETRYNYYNQEEMVTIFRDVITFLILMPVIVSHKDHNKDGFVVVTVKYNDKTEKSLIYKMPSNYLLADTFIKWFSESFLACDTINKYHHVAVKNNFIYINNRKYNIDKHKIRFMQILTLIESIQDKLSFYEFGEYHAVLNLAKINKETIKDMLVRKQVSDVIVALNYYMLDDENVININNLINAIENDEMLVSRFIKLIDTFEEHQRKIIYEKIRCSIGVMRTYLNE